MFCAGVAASYSQYELGFTPSNIEQLKTDAAALANFTEAVANKTAEALQLPAADVVVKGVTFTTEGATSRRRRALAAGGHWQYNEAAASVQRVFKGQGLLWAAHVATNMQLSVATIQV